MELLPALTAGDDEPRLLEHAQVLHDTEPGHVELGVELSERAAVTLVEQVEQEAPARIGQRPERGIVVVRHRHRKNM